MGKDFEVQTVSGRERPAGTPTKGREGVWTQEEWNIEGFWKKKVLRFFENICLCVDKDRDKKRENQWHL